MNIFFHEAQWDQYEISIPRTLMAFNSAAKSTNDTQVRNDLSDTC